MTGLDTNVLIRYLVKDEPRQSGRAARLMQEVLQRGDSLFLNHIVLCELVWVLESAYGYPKADIASTLEKILMTEQFEIEGRDEVWSALDGYEKDRGDFSDYLIGRKNQHHSCSRTVTFDRSLKDDPTFELL
ncbi:type II toxin-antitoxin system VapC family toxin [Acidobacteria bacterium AH-259-G07]|nr:type II toxin-antitoxin system VapC family toxin [Acidobacteria bacterium AH-259-G07]